MTFKHLACLGVLLLSASLLMADIVYPMAREDRDYNTTATEKLDRGVQNILFCWTELPNSLWRQSDEYNNAGFMKGSSDGIRNTGVRFAQGVFDTLTFPWNTGNFELPWDPPPNYVHPESIPAIQFLIPGAVEVDQYHQDWIDGWEAQRDP